jgi:hypothetical protein
LPALRRSLTVSALRFGAVSAALASRRQTHRPSLRAETCRPMTSLAPPLLPRAPPFWPIRRRPPLRPWPPLRPLNNAARLCSALPLVCSFIFLIPFPFLSVVCVSAMLRSVCAPSIGTVVQYIAQITVQRPRRSSIARCSRFFSRDSIIRIDFIGRESADIASDANGQSYSPPAATTRPESVRIIRAHARGPSQSVGLYSRLTAAHAHEPFSRFTRPVLRLW